jgi:hypothetical protein
VAKSFDELKVPTLLVVSGIVQLRSPSTVPIKDSFSFSLPSEVKENSLHGLSI